MSIYFGGSRNLQSSPIIPQVVAAVVAAGQSVHVGCQRGADQQVIQSCPPSSLLVFAAAPVLSACAWHIRVACGLGADVRVAAGGSSAPMPARYLLRSIAAFQNCKTAVFFSPGNGSLAVAREFAKTKNRIFAFQQEKPAPIPETRGEWCIAWLYSFQCWAWGYLPEPKEKQISLF